MALDGSFSLKRSLERFLARCPKLQSISRLNLLLQKEDKLTDEEVVNSVAELFLHPNYTIPMMGCFRPIIQKIVDKVVDLLQLVKNLKSNSGAAVVEIGDGNYNVIGFCVRSGMGLMLHELASLAFCRALDLAPFLLRSVLSYFKFEFAPPPFQCLLAADSTSQLIEKEYYVYGCLAIFVDDLDM